MRFAWRKRTRLTGTVAMLCVLASAAVADEPSSRNERGLDAILAQALDTSPRIRAIELAYAAREAAVVRTQGPFDPVIEANGDVMPLGEDTKSGVSLGISQRIGVLWGAALRAGYSNRREPRVYDGKLATSEWGEFYGEVDVPLLKDGYIDKARTSAEVAGIGRDAALATQEKVTLDFVRGAADRYLDWKAAQFSTEVAKWLRQVATYRAGLVDEQVRTGLRAPVELWDNGRLVAEREAEVQKSEAVLEVAALDVGGYVAETDAAAAAYLDATPRPLFVHERLENRGASGPRSDDASTPDFLERDHAWHAICGVPFQLEAELDARVSVHPQIVAAERKLAAVEAKRNLAVNQLLPKLDLKGYVRQDVGEARVYGVDYKTKKTTEAGVGLSFSFPTLSRGARGALSEGNVSVQVAENALRAARIGLSTRIRAQSRKLARSCTATTAQSKAADLAIRVEAAAAQNYAAGGTDLLALNLREKQAAGALLKLGAAIIATERAYMQLYWLVGPAQVVPGADAVLASL